MVDGDVDKDVEGSDLGDVDRDQATVRVVNEEITFERTSGVIIDAARPVGDIAHDERLGGGTETGQDIGDGRRKQEETFRKLQGNFPRTCRPNSMNSLVDLERIVGG